jgi:hypothetical protein
MNWTTNQEKRKSYFYQHEVRSSNVLIFYWYSIPIRFFLLVLQGFNFYWYCVPVRTNPTTALNKWYMKLFQRLLNSTVLNALILYQESTRRRIEQLSYWVQLVEGLKGMELWLNTKCQCNICLMIECCDLRKDISLWEFCQQAKSPSHRDDVPCAPSMGRGGTQYGYRNSYTVSVIGTQCLTFDIHDVLGVWVSSCLQVIGCHDTDFYIIFLVMFGIEPRTFRMLS